MTYRSERFDPGEMEGLRQAWELVDLIDNGGVPVVSEVMAGTSYRRAPHPDTQQSLGDINYLLQVPAEPALREDNARLHAKPFLDWAGGLLEAIDLQGETLVDLGGLNGWDITTTTEHPFGTGKTETEVLQVYPPWLNVAWEEAGKRCLFYFGIQPPQPKPMMEDWKFDWGEQKLRQGLVVFKPTPDGLETW